MTSALGLKLQEAIEAAEARKAMAEWTTPVTTPTPMTTNPISLSELTFNTVRDNPGTPKGQIIAMLEKDGHKAVSTTSLLSAMIRYGAIIMGDRKTLHTVGDVYKSRVTFNKSLAQKRKVVRMIKKAAPEVEAPVPLATSGIDAIINSLSLHSAIELRNRLNKLFAEVA
jgi:hypothetical protein